MIIKNNIIVYEYMLGIVLIVFCVIIYWISIYNIILRGRYYLYFYRLYNYFGRVRILV